MGDLDIGEIYNGDQGALSYRNEWATLILVTYKFNGNIISDEKFKGDFIK